MEFKTPFYNLSDKERAIQHNTAVKEAVEKYVVPSLDGIYEIDFSLFNLIPSEIRFFPLKRSHSWGMIKVFHYEDQDIHCVRTLISNAEETKKNSAELTFSKNRELNPKEMFQLFKDFTELLSLGVPVV